jgi:CHAT domain-containing protein
VTDADREALDKMLDAGKLLQELMTESLATTMSAARRLELLEQLLAAQRAEYDAAVRASGEVVRPDDVLPRLLNTLLMFADAVDPTDPGRADALRAEAAEASKRLGVHARLDLLRSTAQSAHARGDFVTGLDQMAEAIGLLGEGADVWKVARTTMDRTDILQQLGDFEAAYEGVAAVRELLAGDRLEPNPAEFFKFAEQRIERSRLEFDVEFQTGLIERGRGNLDGADAAIARAADVAARLRQPAETVRYQHARIALDRGDAAQATRVLDAAEPVLQAIAPHRMHAVALCRGRASLIRGDVSSAIRELERARTGATAAGDHEVHAKASWRLAQAFEGVDPAAASAAYRDACDAVDRARRSPLGYRLDNCFLADKYDAFRDAIRWFSSRGDAESSLRAMELVKSRRLMATLSTPRSTSPRQRERAAELASVSHRLDALSFGTAPADAGQQAQLERRRLELIAVLRRDDPRYRSLTLAPLDVRSLRETLGSIDAVALDLFMLDATTVVGVLVTPSESVVATRTLEDSTRAGLEAFLANLRKPEPAHGAFDLSAGFDVDFDDLVPADLVAPALSATRLVIAPHRELHLVPWAALALDDAPICTRTAVGIVPCLSCVPALSKPLAARPALALFGPPRYESANLDMTDYLDELDALEAALGGRQARPKLEGATIEALRTMLGSTAEETSLVVACHGTFDPTEPLRSALMLSDGNLDAANLMHGDVVADEVFLRACSTGHRVERVGNLDLVGDDILGLPGSLLEAGVRSIVVSIPPLVRTPTTRKLFTKFLDNRRGGATPLLALAAAQRALVDAGDDASHWAGVTVYGAL